MAQNEIKFVNEANLRRYTKKVKAADDAASRTVESEATTSSTTGEYPLHLNHAAYSASNPAATATTDKVFVDNNLRYNPATHELKITDGTNTATFSPTGGDAGDFTGTTTVGIEAGTASAAPKVKVKVGSSDEATSGEITKATTGVYGVTKLADSTGTSTTLAATQNLATNSGKTVRQTAQTGNNALPILTAVSATPTSGNSAEAGYDTAMTFNPQEDALSITTATTRSVSKTTVSAGKVDLQKESGGIITKVSIDDMHITFNQGGTEVGSVNPVNYTGKATGTENALASTTSGSEGATMVGYATDTTVKDALDDIYETIGGGGGSSLTDRVEALETGKQDKLTAGDNISISGTTINAVDEKVKQNRDTSDTAYPMLLAGTTNPNGSAQNAKYTTYITANPNDKSIELQGVASAQTPIERTTITPTGITLHMNEANPDTGAGVVSKTGTLTATNYSGTAAQATADGSGNNIVNTYATKAALDALTQKWTGQFVVLKSTGDTAQQYTALNNILAAIAAGQTPAAADLAKLDLGYIYLLENGSGTNVYDEYIKVATGTSTYSVEKIGTTDAGVDVVSLTDAEIDSIWANPDAA